MTHTSAKIFSSSDRFRGGPLDYWWGSEGAGRGGGGGGTPEKKYPACASDFFFLTWQKIYIIVELHAIPQ